MVRGAGVSSNGGITRPSSESRPAQSLSRWQHKAFWAISGHFRRSLWSACRTAITPSPSPGQISAQSLFLQSTLALLQLCPLPLRGGTTAAATTSGKQAFCLPSAPVRMHPQPACSPPPRGCKNPCCRSLVHKASWC